MACSFLSNLRPVSPSERGHLCPYVYCLVHPRLLPAGFSGLLLCHRPHSLRCGGQLVTIPLGPQVLRWTEGEREKEEEKAKSFGDKGKGKKGAGRRGEQFHGLPVPSQHAIVPGTSVMWGPVLSGDTLEVPPQLSKIPRGEFLEGWAPLSGEVRSRVTQEILILLVTPQLQKAPSIPNYGFFGLEVGRGQLPLHV